MFCYFYLLQCSCFTRLSPSAFLHTSSATELVNRLISKNMTCSDLGLPWNVFKAKCWPPSLTHSLPSLNLKTRVLPITYQMQFIAWNQFQPFNLLHLSWKTVNTYKLFKVENLQKRFSRLQYKFLTDHLGCEFCASEKYIKAKSPQKLFNTFIENCDNFQKTWPEFRTGWPGPVRKQAKTFIKIQLKQNLYQWCTVHLTV